MVLAAPFRSSPRAPGVPSQAALTAATAAPTSPWPRPAAAAAAARGLVKEKDFIAEEQRAQRRAKNEDK
jgi:hypothetical protein